MKRTVIDVHLVSTTNASDLGFLALADVAAALSDLENDEWCIIGGHMVQLLIHAYPTPGSTQRGTADADAGVSPQIAASRAVHERLRERKYTDKSGNRYIRDHVEGTLAIDILVPGSAGSEVEQLGGRAFDQAPGLLLALNSPALRIRGHVRLRNGEGADFDVQVPDVEAAIVLKALAWKSRYAEKDVSDLANLFEIVDVHRENFVRWSLHNSGLTGARGDTACALTQLVTSLDRGKIRREVSLGRPPARLAALIRAHVALF